MSELQKQIADAQQCIECTYLGAQIYKRCEKCLAKMQKAEALEQNIRIALWAVNSDANGAFTAGEPFVAGILRDVLAEVAKGECQRPVAISPITGNPISRDLVRVDGLRDCIPHTSCGECIVCIAREVVKG